MKINWKAIISSAVGAVAAFFALVFGITERRKRREAEEVLDDYRSTLKKQQDSTVDAVVRTSEELKEQRSRHEKETEDIPSPGSVDERLERLRKSR